MNAIKKSQLIFAIIVSVFALGFLTPVARAQRDGNVGDPHRAINIMPPVGIAFGQTLRVNFLNVGSNPLPQPVQLMEFRPPGFTSGGID